MARTRVNKYDEENRGPVETAVRQDLERIGLDSSMSDSYAEICFSLARKLDNDAGMAHAAVAKELRETLQVIEEAAGDGDDELLSRFNAAMPTAIRHAS